MRWTFVRKISFLIFIFIVSYIFLTFTNFSSSSSQNHHPSSNRGSRKNSRITSDNEVDNDQSNVIILGKDENGVKNEIVDLNSHEYNNNDEDEYRSISANNKNSQNPPGSSLNDIDRTQNNLIDDIQCVINGGDITLTCLRDKQDEIYLPFKQFLQKYYEVTGYVTRRSDGEDQFEWWHSKAKIHTLSFDRYDPRGVFGSFANYNVENRDRVKLISAIDGVPLSTQWGSKPYPYSVQIAQYALEHYSKNLTESNRLETIIENGKSDKTQWQVAPEARKFTKFRRIFDDTERKSFVFDFKTLNDSEKPGLFVKFPRSALSKWPVVRFYAKFYQLSPKIHQNYSNGTAGFTIILQRTDSQTYYYVHYLTTDNLLSVRKPNNIVYGIGSKNFNLWRRFTRNILTDFTKGYALLTGKKKQNRSKSLAQNLRLISFYLTGSGQLSDLSQRTSSHDDHFTDAVDWLIRYQTPTNGGLPIPVRRTIAEGRLVLEPGWHSAMAQGHFLSAVCRAYALTGDERYRRAATKALALFETDAQRNGVRAYFLNSSSAVWYEEYPTRPAGTFVLNGFIYALLGLYDSEQLCNDTETSQRLYQAGLQSLKTLLPMFDTGSGSMYDLRHVTLSGLAPNLARWDYHAVHVYQLYWLYAIERDPFFKTTADRWLSYAKGARAKHN